MKTKLISLAGLRGADRLRSASLAVGLAGSVLLGGCSITGFGSSGLTCKLPDGARCDSVSNTYNESQRGTLPGQLKRKASDAPDAAPSGTSARSADGSTMYVDPRMTSVGMPLRSQARIARVWIKPWEDSDGDLHDQTFVYLPVDEGKWLVEHKQREVRQAYAPVRPTRPTSGGMDMKTSLPAAPGGQQVAASPAAAKQQEKAAEAVKRIGAANNKAQSGSAKAQGDGSGS